MKANEPHTYRRTATASWKCAVCRRGPDHKIHRQQVQVPETAHRVCEFCGTRHDSNVVYNAVSMCKDCHRIACDVVKSAISNMLSEALNSGDGSYKP